MMSSPPIIPTRKRALERLALIKTHTNALRRRLRGGSETERAVATGYLDAIDQDAEAAAVLIQALRDEKPPAPTS